MSLELRILGPIEASADGRSLPLGGPKPRAVLAMLGLEANRTVTADHLVDGLWGERPPPSAAKMVQTYVWRLRNALGDDAGAKIVTRGPGYELRIDPEAIDVGRFQRLLAAATRADAAGEPADAAREALALWRGPPLADVADEPFAAAEIRRLEELRIEAAELAVAADLAAGRHHQVAAEIDALVAEHPLRERLAEQRMLALYRCGRQADALAAYRETRRTLVDAIGVEPGPELRRLHEAILAQDPSLELPVVQVELPRELETAAAPPLVGRESELAWLRARWQRAQAGSGELVTIAGDPGMGKTRLAAELAGEAHRDGAVVLYASGTAVSRAAIAQTAHATRATLLVVDDADTAPAGVRAELGRLHGARSLVVATGRDGAALAALPPDGALVLEPLDAAAVRQIALLHAPAGAEASLPVETLLDTSGGVPRRVHEAAASWARREATRRVDAVAGRAAGGRTRALEVEAELAESVVALQSVDERGWLEGPDGEASVVCPYKGLAPFDAEDADYFFGREQLVARLVAQLVGAPLLAVVGPSGSGKSSIVRAGVLPALAAGVLPGSERWARCVIRPGEHPLRELRRATGRVDDRRRLVLAVDQFEELFTACADERERREFVAALTGGARDARGRRVVVLAVRADFYGRCAAYPELGDLMGANHVLVGSMSRGELRRAVELPARRAGLHVEPGLVERLLDDCEGEPGALPLLSTALLELWQRRDGRELRLAAYERSGGVRGAVARLAEAAYERLAPAHQATARRVLLRLAGEDVHGAPVRRRVGLAELEPDRDADVRRVLAVLTDSRMVTVSEGAVEVAHEALLGEWPRLRGWFEEDREGRRVQRRLVEAAREWSEGGCDAADLYRGARLATALEWRVEHEPELNATEQRFLDVSRAAGERARRRLRLALAGALALLAVASGAALLALHQQGRARAEARAAEGQRLGAQAVNEPALDRALLLAREGVALDDTPATRDELLAVLRRAPAAVRVMRGDGDALQAIALQPDGRTLAVGDDDGTITFLDAATGRRVGRPYQTHASSGITSLAFSPDGSRLASGGRDTNAAIDLFDGHTRRHIARLGGIFTQTGTPTLRFSPDSRLLMARAAAYMSLVFRWDARTGRPISSVHDVIPGVTSMPVGFLGSRLVTAGDPTQGVVVRDAATLRTVRRFGASGSVAALSPATGLVALGGRDGSVTLLDLRSGRVRTARGGQAAAVVAMRFSPGGERLVSAGRDGRMTVWDPRRGSAVETLDGRGLGRIEDLEVARGGRTAYSARADGTVIAWDLTGERRWERPFGLPETSFAPASLTVAARAPRVAAVDADGFVDVFDSATLRLIGRIRPAAARPGPVIKPDARDAGDIRRGGGHVAGAALAPDGRTLALTTDAGELEFFDTSTGRLLDEEVAHAYPTWAVTFSADGRWLATGGGDSIVRLWNARSHAPAGNVLLAGEDSQSGRGGASDLSFSPDGRTLAITRREVRLGRSLELYSVPGLELIRAPRLPPGTVGRFSADGRWLVYGDRNGRMWTLDTRSWRPRRAPLKASAAILTADLSPDGRRLATTSADGTGRLWDVASQRPIGATLSGGAADPIAAAFVAGGARLAVLHRGGGVVWDVRPASWARRACAVAGRPLTRSEWAGLLPRRDYAPECGRR